MFALTATRVALAVDHFKSQEVHVAKPKTKKTVMDTLAVENKPGEWTFDTSNYSTWMWSANVLGINLFRMRNDGNEVPVIHCKSLDHAVMYAWGFLAGQTDEQNRVRIPVNV